MGFEVFENYECEGQTSLFDGEPKELPNIEKCKYEERECNTGCRHWQTCVHGKENG